MLLCLSFIAALGFTQTDSANDVPRQDPAAEQFFKDNVQPILAKHCYECHSHRAKKAEGGLVLDSRSGWEKGGQSGPAVVPGMPQQSLLIQAVQHRRLKMPPKGRLPDELIGQLARWVRDGAHDPRGSKAAGSGKADFEGRHWAFQPLARSVPPTVQEKQWAWGEIDAFILARLERAGVRPVADAGRFTWLRRISFDLTGLPPTAESIREFAADESPQARGRLIDRLLASRGFGERWARHWLDLVGYADQVGTSNSVFAQHAWRYRDYLVESFNADKPFDQFIREQIAGDLLPAATAEQRAANLTATGFLVLGDIEIVEADKAKLLVDIVDQQLNKVGKSFLGMTLECVRCHDHKFDPISQRDYYAMAGFFHGTSSVYKTDRGVWSDVNVLELPETEAQKADRRRRQNEHTERINTWRSERKQAQQRRNELDKLLSDQNIAKERRDQLTKERKEISSRIGALNQQILHGEFFAPDVPKAHGVRDAENPSDMRITIRGNPRALGEFVPRGFLRVLSAARPEIPHGQSGRLQLADWVAANPLSARVVVNRIWQKLFGEGLVRSVDYFGLPGDKPSHPELLDYLAARFVHNGYSLKQLVRSLVLSRTYALASVHDEIAHAADPANRLLWRMNRFRLDAESLRDAMIMVSGQLKRSGAGPAMPLEFPENVGGLDPKDVNPPNFRFTRWRPRQQFERTIYLPVIRHAAQPGPATLRNVFDFAQPSQFTGKRAVTAVPTQALFLMNSPVIKKHAAALAARISQQTDESKRLDLLWLTLLNRPLSETERGETLRFLKETQENGWAELCHALLASNEFLMRL